MYWVNTSIEAHFALIIIYCCACSKTSISINKYMQKAGEPENDAGFLKHNSQLNCSYSYPSKPRLVVTVLSCTSMVCLSGFNATYTRPYIYRYTATACMSSHVH